MLGAVLIVLFGTIPAMRPTFLVDGKTVELSMTHIIEITMLVVSLLCKPNIDDVAKRSVFQSGMTGVNCIFGLAWMGDTLITAYLPDIKAMTQQFVQAYPWTFAIGLMCVASVVLS